MPGQAVGLSSSQRGKIAEYYLATALISGSGGRLSPFVPLVDDHGVDLLVFDKATGGTVAVQVKSWFGPRQGDRRTVQFDVRKSTYRDGGDTVLVALILDDVSMALEMAWLIPMPVLPAVSVDQLEKYVIAPSRSDSSRDRYSPFRYRDVRSLSRAIQGITADRATGAA